LTNFGETHNPKKNNPIPHRKETSFPSGLFRGMSHHTNTKVFEIKGEY
jgi:hypothetical protein